jgi:ribonuclease Z
MLALSCIEVCMSICGHTSTIPYALPDPCIGYIIRESSGPKRKLVILGDTHDPSYIIPLCLSPSPSLLIHEATDAHIPRHIDPNARRPAELVLEKALSRGHSIPAMAGGFAKKVGAERLILNHIGGR